MRRLVFVLIVVLFSNLVLAEDIEINFMKENYSKGETLQFEIEINNVQLSGDLTTANIKLKRGDENQGISVNLVKMSETKYFVNFNLPLISGDYKLVLEDVKYTKGDNLVKVSFEKSLVINDLTGISVSPGIIYMNLEKKDNPILNFKLVGESAVKLSIVGDFLQLSETEFTVSGTKTIELKTDVKKNSEGRLNIEYGNSSYSIPIYLFKEEVKEGDVNETVEEDKDARIEFNKELNEVEIIEVSLEFGKDLQGPVYFKNTGSVKLYNLKVNLSESLIEVVSFNLEKSNLDPEEVGEINVIVNPMKDKIGHYEGDLTIITEEGVFASIPFILDLKGREIDPEPTLVEIKEPEKIIIDEELKEEEKNIGIWIFGIILIIIIFLVFVFYKKSKTGKRMGW